MAQARRSGVLITGRQTTRGADFIEKHRAELTH